MVVFGLAPIILFAVFLFYSCLSRFLSLSMVHVFPSFLIYFSTFTSFLSSSPWNLIGLSPLLWRLRIRFSTSQASPTSGNVKKRRKWQERRGHWRLRLRTSCDAVKINVLCNMRESKHFQDASIHRRRIRTSFILLVDPMNHIAFVYIKIVFLVPMNLLWNWRYQQQGRTLLVLERVLGNSVRANNSSCMWLPWITWHNMPSIRQA